MPSIDNRIVQMAFDNKQFENGIKESTKSLDNLKKGLSFDGGSLRHIEVALDTISKRFTNLGIIGVTALQNITNAAINAAKKMVSSLSFDQINAGFNKYEQSVASVQTIMNSTGKSIDEVNGYLAKLMWFSDETSYGFTDMTAALAQMTSSGGDVEKLIPLITGVANATAYAGKGAAEFSRAMYNLNQSYGMGYLQSIDWKSLELAGVGSKQLKQTLIDTGVALGTIKKGEVNIGNFQNTLQDKWANQKVMETAFGLFSELSDAAYDLVKQGKFKTAKEAMDSLAGKYSELAEKAFKSAQSAKTLTEAINATKDAVSSGWMRTYGIIVGNLIDATALWSGVTSKLWDTFAAGAEVRNELLQGWKDFGGRESLIGIFVNIYNSLLLISGAIKLAWQSIFPPQTAEGLADATKGIEAFTKSIVDWLTGMNGETTRIEQISKIFEGFFGVLKIGWTIVKAVFNTIADVIGAILPGSAIDGILSFFSDIGGSISDFANNLENNEEFIGFFKSIGDFFKSIISSDVFKKAVAIFKDFIAAIPSIVSGIWEFAKGIYTYLTTSEDIKKWVKTISDFFAPFIAKIKKWGKSLNEALRSLFGGKAADKGKSFWDLLKMQFATPEGVKTFFDNAIALIKKTWTSFREKVIAIFTGKDNNKLLEGFGGGSGGSPEKKSTFFEILGNFFKDFAKWFSGNWGWVALVAGALGVIKVLSTINQITKAIGFLRFGYKPSGLVSFTRNMIKIAGSIVAVVGAITLLTLLDQTKLDHAFEIVGNITLILLGIAALGAIPALSAGYKLGLGMLGISASIVLMIVAIKKMMDLLAGLKSEEDVNRLTTAIIAVGGLVAGLMILSSLLNGVDFGGKWTTIVGIAIGVWILVKALTPLALLEEHQLWKLVGIFAALTLAIGALMLITKIPGVDGTIKIGGLIGLAIGVALLIEALKPLTEYSWEDLKKMGVVLGGIVASLYIYLKATKGMQAAGATAAILSLGAMAAVIYLLGEALRSVRDVSWEQTTAFTAGMTTMLVGMAVAFKLLGTMSLKDVGIGLLAILGILAIAAIVVYAFGELSRNPDFQDFVNGAASSIGAMIGTFIGSLDAAKIVAFAEGLNAFEKFTVNEDGMTNAIAAAGYLQKFADSLPEKPFLERLSYVFAPTEMETLSRDIQAFGRSIVVLSLAVDSIKKPSDYIGTTKIAVEAIRAVVTFLDDLWGETRYLESASGWDSFWGINKTSMQKVRDNVLVFKDSIVSLSLAVDSIEKPAEYLSTAKGAVDALTAVNTFLKSLGTEDTEISIASFDVVGRLLGAYKTKMEKLRDDVRLFGDAVVTLNTNLTKITDPIGFDEKTTLIISIATRLGTFLNTLDSEEITNNLGHYTFFQTTFLGKEDTTKTLCDHIGYFAKNITDVSSAMAKIVNPEGLDKSVEIAISAATLIGDFLNGVVTEKLTTNLGKYTAFEQIVLGKEDETQTLADHMTTFGNSIKTISTSLSGVSVGTFEADAESSLIVARAILKFLVELTEAGNDFSSGSSKFYALTGAMSAFGQSMSAFEYSTMSLNAERMSLIGNAINDLATSISTLSAMGSPEAKALLASTFSNIADVLSTDFNADLAIGIQNGSGQLAMSIKNLLSIGINVINSTVSKFYETGRNVVQGIANGVSQYAYLATGAMTRLGNSMRAALDASLDVHSPSDITFKTGVQVVDGLVNGIETEGDKAVKAATALGTAVGDALRPKIKIPDKVGTPVKKVKPQYRTNKVKDTGLYWYDRQSLMFDAGVGYMTDYLRDLAPDLRPSAKNKTKHETILDFVEQFTKKLPSKTRRGGGGGGEPGTGFIDSIEKKNKEEEARLARIEETGREVKKDTFDKILNTSPLVTGVTDLAKNLGTTVKESTGVLTVLENLLGIDFAEVSDFLGPKEVKTMKELSALERSLLLDDAPQVTSTKPTKGLSTKKIAGRVNWSETVGKSLSQMRDLTILGDKLDRLGDAVLRMKIVMNSGVVVGQIKSEMDRALGEAALYSGRG